MEPDSIKEPGLGFGGQVRPGFDGLEIHGPYPDRLPNDGGVLRLRDDGEDGRYHPETIAVVVYEDSGGWPRGADGQGSSLALVGTALDNDDQGVDIADATFPLNFLFLGGPPPAAPGPRECGEDATEDELDAREGVDGGERMVFRGPRGGIRGIPCRSCRDSSP